MGIATVYQDLALVSLMSVTRNFFMGREPLKGPPLFKTFDIDVYDSEILQFNTDEYIEDDQGLFLGKKSTTTVTATVTADLIVINGHKSGPRQGAPAFIGKAMNGNGKKN